MSGSACLALLEAVEERLGIHYVKISAEYERMLLRRAPDLYPLYEQSINEMLLDVERDPLAMLDRE